MQETSHQPCPYTKPQLQLPSVQPIIKRIFMELRGSAWISLCITKENSIYLFAESSKM